MLAFGDLLEGILFAKQYLDTIQNGMRGHRSVVDILAADTFKSDIDAIKSSADVERGLTGTTLPPTEDSSAVPVQTRVPVVGTDTTVAMRMDSAGVQVVKALFPDAPVEMLAHRVDKAGGDHQASYQPDCCAYQYYHERADCR